MPKRSSEVRSRNSLQCERNDIQKIWEHLLITGAHQRHQNWRIREYDLTQQHPEAFQKTHGVAQVHAEDVRLYGGFVTEKGHRKHALPAAWPTKREPTNFPVQPWEDEHGDGVDWTLYNNHQFPTFQFHQESFQHLGRCLVNPSVDETPHTDNCNASFQTLVTRCWNRAVDRVASIETIEVDFVLPQDPVTPERNICLPTVPRRRPDDEMPARREMDAETAKTDCYMLGISVPSEAPFVCPNCHVDFGTANVLEKHFYGDIHRGCCWNLVFDKEQQCISGCLERDARTQMQQLLREVLNKVRESVEANNTPRNTPLDWNFVTNTIEHIIASSKDKVLGEHTPTKATDTLEINPGKIPLVLNSQVHRAAKRRLILRYADVPR